MDREVWKSWEPVRCGVEWSEKCGWMTPRYDKIEASTEASTSAADDISPPTSWTTANLVPPNSHATSASRQSAAFLDRGLDAKHLIDPERLLLLEGTAADLEESVFQTLRNELSAIVHNAWTLDFNKSLTSCEPHIKGTRNLIDLALASETGARFLFTSSIDTAIGIQNEIIAASGLDATPFRVGQVCGSAQTGAWSTTDWVPSLVKSSIALGALPSEPTGQIVWLLPEAVSRAIFDVALPTLVASSSLDVIAVGLRVGSAADVVAALTAKLSNSATRKTCSFPLFSTPTCGKSDLCAFTCAPGFKSIGGACVARSGHAEAYGDVE
ncbi:unnamed protein product [Mycena citricolor]|uniref:Thioester reductase (TE) domain-containing protein n=1 Tax=Mycena citricolor TaxID=2018698 RepID=A0AAD2H0R5_9AGAR|nr:unnamed protein product [Mycena citricolor]